jgi:hypothetical protein
VELTNGHLANNIVDKEKINLESYTRLAGNFYAETSKADLEYARNIELSVLNGLHSSFKNYVISN